MTATNAAVNPLFLVRAHSPQPSIFDVLAQESLLASIRPALRRLFRYVITRDPARLHWLQKWEDEFLLGLEMLLQARFLARHSGTFSENFYGIRRRESNGEAGVENARLSKSAVLKSLFVVVLAPYLRKKLADLYERLIRLEADEALPLRYRQLVRAFAAAYPILMTGFQSASFLYQLLYAFGRTQFHDPLEHLAGIRLEFLSPEAEVAPSDSGSESSMLKSTLNGLFKISGRVLSHSFSVGLFLLQFLDVFNPDASGEKADFNLDIFKKLQSFAPPKMAEASETGVSLSASGFFADSNLCPICKGPRTNATALSVSGFVFCYRCILSYLKTHGVCPVTKIPAKPQNLVRLFPAQA